MEVEEPTLRDVDDLAVDVVARDVAELHLGLRSLDDGLANHGYGEADAQARFVGQLHQGRGI